MVIVWFILRQDVLNTMDGISHMLSIGLTQSNKTSIVVTSEALSVGAVQLNPPGEVAANPDMLGTGNLTVDVVGVLDLAGVDPDKVQPTEVLNVSNRIRNIFSGHSCRQNSHERGYLT